jgi:hypothetical protein
MNYKILAAAAAFALVSGGAQAHAYVTGTFAGLNVNQLGAGFNFNFSDPIGMNLDAGTSKTWDFTYLITLHNDGLAADREWYDCAPIPSGCALPPPTGKELAEFDFGFALSKSSSPFFNYSVDGYPAVPFTVAAGSTVTYTGQFSITEIAAPYVEYPFSPGNDSLYLYTLSYVDTMLPVPELPTSALLVAGLACLNLRRRRA